MIRHRERVLEHSAEKLSKKTAQAIRIRTKIVKKNTDALILIRNNSLFLVI